MKKILTVLASAVLAGAMLTACGDKESSSTSGTRIDGGGPAKGQNVADADMPYGAHITTFSPAENQNVSILIDFDNRYFGKEGTDYSEIYLVDRYFDALNNNDVQGVLDCYYPDYLASLCGDGTFATPEEFVETYRSSLAELFTDEFKFDFIDISDCRLSGDLDADTMFVNRDDTLKTAFGDEIIDKITDRKAVTIAGDSYVTAGGDWAEVKSLIPEGIQFCIYTIDGKPYIF